jgi:hypothetical protein
MTRRAVLGVAALVLAAGAVPAIAQETLADNPAGYAVENFFTLRPGGSSSPPPSAFGGAQCSDIVPKVGAQRVWWGRFSGGKVIMGTQHDRMHNKTAEGCFPSQAACERWMFVMASLYRDNPRYNDCRAGYQPGAPVRWVFGSPWQRAQ